MFSKLSIAISAAFVLSAASGVARAAPAPADADFSSAEAGIPDSVDYSNRMISLHSPSSDEINAAETGNPDSVDNRHQGSRLSERRWEAAWQALESGNPDFS